MKIILKHSPLWISIFSLFVSAGALYFTYLQYNNSKEHLVVSIKPIWRGYDTRVVGQFAKWSYILTQWNILISNVSDRAISITSYDLGWHLKPANESKEFIKNSRFMKQGLYENNSLIDIPINIPPGKTISYVLKVGLITTQHLTEKYPSLIEKSIPIENVIRHFWTEYSEDIFGNKLDGYMYIGLDTVIPFPHSSPEKRPYITARLNTSRSNQFYANGDWYDRQALSDNSEWGLDIYEYDRIRFRKSNKTNSADAKSRAAD